MYKQLSCCFCRLIFDSRHQVNWNTPDLTARIQKYMEFTFNRPTGMKSLRQVWSWRLCCVSHTTHFKGSVHPVYTACSPIRLSWYRALQVLFSLLKWDSCSCSLNLSWKIWELANVWWVDIPACIFIHQNGSNQLKSKRSAWLDMSADRWGNDVVVLLEWTFPLVQTTFIIDQSVDYFSAHQFIVTQNISSLPCMTVKSVKSYIWKEGTGKSLFKELLKQFFYELWWQKGPFGERVQGWIHCSLCKPVDVLCQRLLPAICVLFSDGALDHLNQTSYPQKIKDD